MPSRQAPQPLRQHRQEAPFFAFLGIRTAAQLRRLPLTLARGALLAWKRRLEASGAAPATVRRRLARLSCVFSPETIDGMARATREGRPSRALPFSASQVRAILDAPAPTTLRGLRDRAVLAVGFQAGFWLAPIVRLKVRDFDQAKGVLGLGWQGGPKESLALEADTLRRIHDYLVAAGHAEDLDGPLFRPVHVRGRGIERPISPAAIYRILPRYLRRLRIRGRYSAHSLRVAFIAAALERGVSLEEAWRAAGYAYATALGEPTGQDAEKSAARLQ